MTRIPNYQRNPFLRAIDAMAAAASEKYTTFANSFRPAYRPSGQGSRECARRRGGNHWKSFRDADRVARGLPSLRRVEQIFSPD